MDFSENLPKIYIAANIPERSYKNSKPLLCLIRVPLELKNQTAEAVWETK